VKKERKIRASDYSKAMKRNPSVSTRIYIEAMLLASEIRYGG
jgi:hypothetical protein